MIFNTIEKELLNFYQLEEKPKEKCHIDYGTNEETSKIKVP